MKYCRHDHVVADARELKDGDIFTVYKDDSTWAFGMRIRGMFTFTSFRSPNSDADEVRRAQKQIMFCKIYGWSYLGKKAMNPESYEIEPEFMCMYCHATSFDTTEPCACRGKKLDDLFVKTSKGGIILPY